MAAPSYTYNLVNASTADASQVMQNYNDILNGVTDGTKDLTINALICNGPVSFKGSVALGDASADDVTFTGSLASSIPLKTTNAFDIGSASLGLRAAYFGANSQTAKIVGNTGMAGAVVATLPVATDTLVGRATADTLTNKDISSSTNTYRAAVLATVGAVLNGATTYTNTGLTWTNTSTPATYSIVARRTGNLVNVMMTFPTTTVSSGSAISIGTLAADFQPSTTKYTCVAGLLSATNNMSLVGVTTAGNILLYKNTNFGVWTISDTTNTAGVALSFTYSLD